MTFLSRCVHTSLFSRAFFFSVLMISSLFGNSTLWHGREMSTFGWGRISVVLDLLGSLFSGALNFHSTVSVFSYLLLQSYLIIINQRDVFDVGMCFLLRKTFDWAF